MYETMNMAGAATAPAPGTLVLVRERPNYRRAIATLLPALYLLYLLLIWPMTGGGIVTSTANINKFVFPVLASVSVVLFLAERPWDAMVNRFAFIGLVALWGYSGLSVGWALAPPIAMQNFVVLTLTMLGVCLSTSMIASVEDAIRPMFWVICLVLVINLMIVFIRAPGPIGHEGIYGHKNQLGAFAAPAMIFAIYGMSQPGRFYKLAAMLIVPVALIILIKSQSKTSLGFAILAPSLGLMVMIARSYFRIAFPIILVLIVSLGFLLLSGNVIDLSIEDVSNVVSGDGTFTGRTPLWAFAIEHISQRPWLGHGLGSFWQIGQASPQLHAVENFVPEAGHGHNGYIDTLLTGGIVGLGLLATVLLVITHWIGRVIDESPLQGWFLASMLFFMCLHNLLESNWLDSLAVNHMLLLFMATCAIRAMPARPKRTLMRIV